MPADVSAQDPSPAPWLQHIISYGESGPALQFSLKALAMTRLGWINGDAALSTRGRSNYGLALKSLQKALYDKTLMWQDDTLASAYCLSIYEVCYWIMQTERTAYSPSSSKPQMTTSRAGTLTFLAWGT